MLLLELHRAVVDFQLLAILHVFGTWRIVAGSDVLPANVPSSSGGARRVIYLRVISTFVGR